MTRINTTSLATKKGRKTTAALLLVLNEGKIIIMVNPVALTV